MPVNNATGTRDEERGYLGACSEHDGSSNAKRVPQDHGRGRARCGRRFGCGVRGPYAQDGFGPKRREDLHDLLQRLHGLSAGGRGARRQRGAHARQGDRGRAHRPEAHVRPRRLHPHAHRAGEAHPVPHEARRGHRAWRRSVGAHQLGRGHRHHLYEDQGVPGRIWLGQRVLLHLRHYRASQHVQSQPFGERGPVLAPEPHHRLRAHAGYHVHGGRLLLSGRRRHGSRLPNEHLCRVGP